MSGTYISGFDINGTPQYQTWTTVEPPRSFLNSEQNLCMDPIDQERTHLVAHQKDEKFFFAWSIKENTEMRFSKNIRFNRKSHDNVEAYLVVISEI